MMCTVTSKMQAGKQLQATATVYCAVRYTTGNNNVGHCGVFLFAFHANFHKTTTTTTTTTKEVAKW